MRIALIDELKGICMLMVVMVHARGYFNVEWPVVDWMAILVNYLFFFLSGLFFKEQQPFGVFVKSKTKRLLLPFLFWYYTVSVGLANVGYYVFGHELQTVHGLPSLWAWIWPEVYPNIPIWFLWTLFIVSVVYKLLSICLNNNLKLFSVAFLLGLGMYYLDDNGVNLPANIDKMLLSLPAFSLGHIANKGFKKWCAGIDEYRSKYNIFNYWKMLIVKPLSYLGINTMIVLPTHSMLLLGIAPICLPWLTGTDLIDYLILIMIVLLPYPVLVPLMRKFVPWLT